MNSINELEVEKYSENPDALVTLVDSVFNKLLDPIDDSELRQKQAQLIEVSRSIAQLSKLSIPIPDELRSLKLNLLTDIENKSQRREELGKIAARLGNIVARIESSFSTKPSKKRRTRKRTKRSTLPHTKLKVLRAEIIDALRVLGGAGTSLEVRDIIEERMKDRFLPGDLEKHRSSHRLVWKTHIHVARQGLKTAGILRSDSPTGTWELSEDNI